VCAVRQNCAEKNIRLAGKYYKFGWNSASRKYSATARRRLTKFSEAALGGGAVNFVNHPKSIIQTVVGLFFAITLAYYSSLHVIYSTIPCAGERILNIAWFTKSITSIFIRQRGMIYIQNNNIRVVVSSF